MLRAPTQSQHQGAGIRLKQMFPKEDKWPQVHGKMPSITSHQGHTDQNHNETSPVGRPVEETASPGEDVEKGNPPYTVGV